MNDSVIIRVLKKLQYQMILRLQPRKNITRTEFFRFYHQYSVLCDKVIPFIRDGNPAGTGPLRLEIIVFACSFGAEPYSLSSILLDRFPEIDFRIRAFDIVPELIEKARKGHYNKGPACQNPIVNEGFVDKTFDIEGEIYRIKEPVMRKVSFEVGSILDDGLVSSLGQVDLVFGQNFLFHLKRKQARAAFINLVRLMKPRAALFINGMDTDMRIKLTKRFNLDPVNYLIEEIHRDAASDRGKRWATRYWGREPFSRADKEWVRKFCTVYQRHDVPSISL